MSAAQFLGAAILGGLFFGMFAVIAVVDSIEAAVSVFLFTVAVMALVFLGTYLLTGGA